VTQQDHFLGGTYDVYLLGIRSESSKVEQRNFGQSVTLGVERTWDITITTLTYVAGIIRGKQSAKQLSGPLGIARTTGYVTTKGGINALIQLAALLSVSIGLINLFPIPMLDGGHLMYYAAEAVRGKPLGQNAQDIGFKVGFALVLTLMIVATWNDIARFFSS
ncbi:MAG: RIP metalloprotease, partial [Rhizobiales bacterium]|nr:RIP metalloprotease [Hyphomicrobiales bacterium]